MTTIGARIKARRLELDMSQDELARLVGYKSRSSINKIESDGRLLPQRKIMEIANALNTTPAYIMGWEESNEAESPSVTLTPPTKKVPKDLKKILEDEEVTLNGRMMSSEDKEKMMRIIEAAFYEAKEMNKRK